MSLIMLLLNAPSASQACCVLTYNGILPGPSIGSPTPPADTGVSRSSRPSLGNNPADGDSPPSLHLCSQPLKCIDFVAKSDASPGNCTSTSPNCHAI